MQKLVAAILFLAFLGQTFNQGWYYLDYLVRKKEFMSRCVNKARPQMHCNGQCRLMKKIEEQQRKEQGQPPEMKFASKMEVLSSTSSFQLPFDFFTELSKTEFFNLNSGIPIDQPSSVFHPPPYCC